MPRTRDQLLYALADITDTLTHWADEPHDHPYVAKLLREQESLLRQYARLTRSRGRATPRSSTSPAPGPNGRKPARTTSSASCSATS